MGLDAVELVMEVEEYFGIELSDDRASRIRTLGDLYEEVLDKLGVQTESRKICYQACRTRVLLHVKDDLETQLGIGPADVQPGRLLEDLFPLEDRRSQWKKLQQTSGLKYPDLQFPPWSMTWYTYGTYVLLSCLFVLFILFITPLRDFLSGFSVLAPFIQNLGRVTCGVGLFLIVYWILCPILGRLFFSRFRRAFPYYLESKTITVGDLVSLLLWLNRVQVLEEVNEDNPSDDFNKNRARIATNQSSLKEHDPDRVLQSKYSESNEIWRSIRWLVAQQVGVSEDQLTPETDFVKDLGF